LLFFVLFCFVCLLACDAGIYFPPDSRPSWDAKSNAVVQLIFQRPSITQSASPPQYSHLVVSLDVLVRVFIQFFLISVVDLIGIAFDYFNE
jgi:hypothetical protein